MLLYLYLQDSPGCISPVMHGASFRWIGRVKTIENSGMCSVFFGRHATIAGRMACILAAMLLVCASSVHGQVVEEGGFSPVKGGSASEESFSLSCPAHLYVSVGASVVLSCTATGVPEEGVRYGWKSVSGDGLRFLSDMQALDPLFTAPFSGVSSEYAYRLTAMGAGIYRTATVTVSVEENISGESPGVAVVQEECDPFTIPDEFGGGCLDGKAPAPFGFGVESEGGFLFPEAPGLPDRPSGPVRGGSGREAPPRLDCPVAVFLEELETGSIECHAWDASGEEYLEYSWEPVGSTTRDYLDNPRLLPENAPNPSVVAPEAPRYETLESFHSGDRALRYRYRLTATSRLTGLSSREEVEVFVSSSRPSVYCPLEVVVEEGETAQLDCEGADPLSARMDYDEEAASILWEWEGLWGTSTAPLAAKDLSSPLFTAPLGSAGEEYHYIASMTTSASGAPRTARRRVTVTVTGEEDVSGRMNNPSLTIPGNPFTVNEWQRGVEFEIRRYDPGIMHGLGYELIDSAPDALYYAVGDWTPRGYQIHRLGFFAQTDWNNDNYQAPCVDEDTTWKYKICLLESRDRSAGDYLVSSCSAAAVSEEAIADLSVTILDTGNPSCNPRPSVACGDREALEGGDNLRLHCSVTNAPPDAAYSWSGTDIADRLSGTTGLEPTFYVPEDVDSNTDYNYTITMSADGEDRASDDIKVTVLDRASIGISCPDPAPVYEGSADDVVLYCRVTNRPPGTAYSWSSLGSASDTERLSSTTESRPTFRVPHNVDTDTDYKYRVTLSVTTRDGTSIVSRSADITVTVKDKPDITVTCEDSPYEADEGDFDIKLECEASGAPDGSTYTWSWSPIANLTDHDTATPTFAVPDNLDEDKTYTYTVKANAENAEAGVANVIVRVYDTDSPVPVVSCTDSEVYEGSADFDLRCTVRNEPSGATYSWTGPDVASRLTGIKSLTPTFDVPEDIRGSYNNYKETYEYRVTMSAAGIDNVTEDVTVTVLEKPDIECGGGHATIVSTKQSVPAGWGRLELWPCPGGWEGAPSGSSYSYTWTVRGNTPESALSLLDIADVSDPFFLVPASVTEDELYEYRFIVSAENADAAVIDYEIVVYDTAEGIDVVCGMPSPVYEGADDFVLDCSASGAPSGSTYEYVWEAGGDTPDTALLSAADIASPTFLVPGEVNEDETYEYRLTASAANAKDGSAEVTVTVLNKGALAVVCADPGSVYEGSSDIALDCEASGAPGNSPGYTYVWEASGDTPDTALLSAADIASPTFYVPGEVDETTTYEYLLTVSAENAEDAAAEVTVTVLNKGALAVVCADPGSVYEASADITLDCEASGAPGESPGYTYVWEASGDTQDTDELSRADIASPTFYVPGEVDETTTYEYLLTVSAENAEDAAAEVTVTVLNKGALAVVCADPGSVYEASADITLDCEASGAPGESSEYTYVWEAGGDTQDTAQLSAADVVSPTFLVPDEVDETTTYEYLLTASAANAEDGVAEVTVTVLNKGALAVVCTDPGSVYEGSEDIALDCEASGAPDESAGYTYVWEASGNTPDTSLLSAADIASPTFYVPGEVDEDETYEYLLTVSAENAESATAEVTVMVLNKGALSVVCADPGSVYEASADIALDCTASGAPGESSEYAYVWEARGDTQDTALLSAADIASPVFFVPDEVAATTTYEYLLTASAENAESATAEVTVTVLNKGSLALACADPGSVYEASADIALDCEASGAPGDSPQYTYVWEAGGDTPDTSLLSAADIASPTFYVPGEVDEDETYEYLLTVSADNAENATAEVAVTVLDRVLPPPPVVSPPVAEEVTPGTPSTPTALGVTVSASPLRFGVQSSDTQVSLDPVTDQISTHISGPYHVGRMTLAPGGSEALDENGEMDLSIEIASPVVLKRADAIEASSLVLSPNWSYAESCEQLSSQTIGGLYTEVTLSEPDCRLLRFGGELDLLGVASGRYAGSLDVILRSGESEETFAVEVSVTVVPAQRVITIGPGGVRFSTSRELPAGLTEEQNLSIYPDAAFLNEEKPNGVFELSNPSLIPLEISVSARFGYTEATENGREVVVEDASGSRLGDLSQVVDIHPGVLVLMPGEKGLIRYGVQEGALAAMAEQGYAAFFDVVSEPRQYVRSDQMPEEVTGDRTARVTMRVPGVYVPGEGASKLRAELLSLSFVGPRSATFLLETEDHPFVGEVVAHDGDGRELGRQETLVYTRSRVRVPLSRMPEEGAVVLCFSPRGAGRAPEPASIEWDAPRRDIGAAEDKDRATTPEVLVQKP